MRTPQQYAGRAEAEPSLPPGDDERVSGYGVMGQPFSTGHVLGLRRWTASSVGEEFTSIWHRTPDGQWHFYESQPSQVACSRWFGDGVCESRRTDISLAWPTPRTLHVRTADGYVDWRLQLAPSPMTRIMNAAGAMMPQAAWRSPAVLRMMGSLASGMLGVGRVGLAGRTANGMPFQANPLRIWRVSASSATIDGVDAGRPEPLPEQARLGDFWIPQRGIFAMGRVFVQPA